MRTWRLSVALLCLIGCASEGREISMWTLDVDGGPQGVEVTLPSTLRSELPLRETDRQSGQYLVGGCSLELGEERMECKAGLAVGDVAADRSHVVAWSTKHASADR